MSKLLILGAGGLGQVFNEFHVLFLTNALAGADHPLRLNGVSGAPQHRH